MLSTVSLYIAHAEAARTYFGSCYGVKKLKSSGKYSYKVAFQRRKNRVMRVSVYTIVCMCINTVHCLYDVFTSIPCSCMNTYEGSDSGSPP